MSRQEWIAIIVCRYGFIWNDPRRWILINKPLSAGKRRIPLQWVDVHGRCWCCYLVTSYKKFTYSHCVAFHHTEMIQVIETFPTLRLRYTYLPFGNGELAYGITHAPPPPLILLIFVLHRYARLNERFGVVATCLFLAWWNYVHGSTSQVWGLDYNEEGYVRVHREFITWLLIGWRYVWNFHGLTWASYKIRKLNAGNVFPAADLKGNR